MCLYVELLELIQNNNLIDDFNEYKKNYKSEFIAMQYFCWERGLI